MATKAGPEPEVNKAVRELLGILLNISAAVPNLERSLQDYVTKIAEKRQQVLQTQFIAEPLFKDIPPKYLDKIDAVLREEVGISFDGLIKHEKVDQKRLDEFLTKNVSFDDDKILGDLNRQRSVLEEQQKSKQELQAQVKNLLRQIRDLESQIGLNMVDVRAEKDSVKRSELETANEELKKEKDRLEKTKNNAPYKDFLAAEKQISDIGDRILDRKAMISLEKSLQFFLNDSFYKVLKASYVSSEVGAEQRFQLCIDTLHTVKQRGAKKEMAARKAAEASAEIETMSLSSFLSDGSEEVFDDFVFSAIQMLSNLEVLRTFPKNKAVEHLNRELSTEKPIDPNSKFMILNVLVRIKDFIKNIKEFDNEEERKNMIAILEENGVDIKKVEEQLVALEKIALAEKPAAIREQADGKPPQRDMAAELRSAERKMQAKPPAKDKGSSPKTSMFDRLKRKVINTLVEIEATLGEVPSPAPGKEKEKTASTPPRKDSAAAGDVTPPRKDSGAAAGKDENLDKGDGKGKRSPRDSLR